MLYFQDQILIGTVLGGSSLVRPPKGTNYYLSMRSQNVDWLQYKMLEMPTYFPNPKLHKYGNTFRCNSCCSEVLTDCYEKLYQGNRRVPSMEVLDLLNDTGWTAWWLDGGGLTGRGKKNAYLNTTKFGPEGTQVVCDYFNSLDVYCNVNRDKSRLKVLFTVPGTLEFFKVIGACVPSFMFDRLGVYKN